MALQSQKKKNIYILIYILNIMFNQNVKTGPSG